MGWSFGYDTKHDAVQRLTQNWNNENQRRGCLAHCYRGNAFSGVLWSVWSIVDRHTGIEVDRYIACDLLRCTPQKDDGGFGRWGYKSVEESSHPYYYSCPPKYLGMVPAKSFPTSVNMDWRKQVAEYHEKRYKKLEKGKTYHARKGTKYCGMPVETITVTSLRPLRGKVNGGAGVYKLRRSCIDRPVEAA